MSGDRPLTPLRPAASLVVFRNGEPAPEILMVRRSPKLVFGSGQMVFPGGRVDPADEEMAQDLPGDRDWNAARIGAIRETLEETGLLVGVDGRVDAHQAREMREQIHAGRLLGDVLSDAGLAPALNTLVPFAHWQPPFDAARRFDTRFLVTGIGTGQVALTADGSESTELVWSSAQAMLERHDRGEEQLMFPTRSNLLQLARYRDYASARDDSLARQIGIIMARIEERPSGRVLTIDAEHGFPDVAMPIEQALRG